MAVTYQGAAVLLGSTDVSDEATEVTLTANTDIPTVQTFSGQVSAQGATNWDGQITVVYDYTAGSAYRLLDAEAKTPTSGGYAMTFQAEGTSTGNEEVDILAILGEAPIEATGDGGVQLRTFPFVVTGTPTFAAQA